jgi:hypothetical protein
MAPSTDFESPQDESPWEALDRAVSGVRHGHDELRNHRARLKGLQEIQTQQFASRDRDKASHDKVVAEIHSLFGLRDLAYDHLKEACDALKAIVIWLQRVNAAETKEPEQQAAVALSLQAVFDLAGAALDDDPAGTLAGQIQEAMALIRTILREDRRQQLVPRIREIEAFLDELELLG